ncbi:MAG TPA: ATP-binding protein [Vicinamibacterales bacterium]|nr:ATP-binding protein [Vicinamibacterales bacterium]
MGRRHVALGQDRTGQPVSLAVRGRNVLIVGDPKSGKSWVAGLLCEQLILQRYSTCVVDPEGDYSGLEALPGVVVLGGSADGPSPRELRVALRYPDVNVVLDLSRMRHAKKWTYIRALLPALADLRRRTGVPHRILSSSRRIPRPCFHGHPACESSSWPSLRGRQNNSADSCSAATSHAGSPKSSVTALSERTCAQSRINTGWDGYRTSPTRSSTPSRRVTKCRHDR